MNVNIVIDLPPMAWVAVFAALLFTAVIATWQVRRIVSDREWESDVRRRSGSMLDAPWYAMDPVADEVSRPDRLSGMYRTKRFERMPDRLAA